MGKLQKIVLLITWYLTQSSTDKTPEWESFTMNRGIPLEDNAVEQYIAWIINGIDGSKLDWEALMPFAQILANPKGSA